MKQRITLAASFAVALYCTASVEAQLPPIISPPENPLTLNKVNLGKALFYDEQLSSSNTVACASCHIHEAGGGDPSADLTSHPGPDGVFGTADDTRGSFGLPLSDAAGFYLQSAWGMGHQVTGRTAPTPINAAYNSEQFWDGRENGSFDDPLTGSPVSPINASLEAQAANPPVGDAEMAHQGRNWNDVVTKITGATPLALASNIPAALDTFINGQTYDQLFTLTFGSPGITPVRIIQAIAAYERVLKSDATRFDFGALTPQEQNGLALFNDLNRAACVKCHAGALFRDNRYHNVGTRPPTEDPGRFAVTGVAADLGAMKTPGLRNVGLRKAYFHNGIFTTLDEVIDFYDRGGDFLQNIDPDMNPINPPLTVQEKADLKAFLEFGLLDNRVANNLPPFDRPTLYMESMNRPSNFGSGKAGSGGIVPSLTSIEPPFSGNPSWTMAVDDAFGGAVASIGISAAQGPGTPLLGLPIHISTPAIMIPIGLSGVGAGDGYWSAPLSIPNGFNGGTLFMQTFVLDAGAFAGFSGTPGMQFTIYDL